MSNTRKKAIQAFVDGLADSVSFLEEKAEESFMAALKRCESPIEELMLARLMFVKPTWIRPGNITGFHSGAGEYRVYQQQRIGDYRVDFLINVTLPWPPREEIQLVVECDGHDFHEKTKEQAARDKARDRYLIEQGYTVLRFTGSEIYRDAAKCAEQVSDVIDKAVDRYVAAGQRRYELEHPEEFASEKGTPA